MKTHVLPLNRWPGFNPKSVAADLIAAASIDIGARTRRLADHQARVLAALDATGADAQTRRKLLGDWTGDVLDAEQITRRAELTG